MWIRDRFKTNRLRYLASLLAPLLVENRLR